MLDGATERTEAAIARAIEHFNGGRYHEALDGFEVPYHELRGEARELYLGLVRIAAALYHFTGGRPLSARKLYASGAPLLARFTPRRDGIELEPLIVELEAVFAPLIAASPEEAAALRPTTAPRILASRRS